MWLTRNPLRVVAADTRRRAGEILGLDKAAARRLHKAGVVDIDGLDLAAVEQDSIWERYQEDTWPEPTPEAIVDLVRYLRGAEGRACRAADKRKGEGADRESQAMAIALEQSLTIQTTISHLAGPVWRWRRVEVVA